MQTGSDTQTGSRLLGTHCSFVLLRAELAEHGFRFCMESLEAKLQKEAALKEEERTGQ